MDTRELIKAVESCAENGTCNTCPFKDCPPSECLQTLFDKVIEKLNFMQILGKMIDDMNNDHYVDYLEFYANRCRKLEEELDRTKK
jgi:hypothetical protein